MGCAVQSVAGKSARDKKKDTRMTEPTNSDVWVLRRTYKDDRTLGDLYAPDGVLFCHVLELPWRDNKRNISCVPEGTYNLVKRVSPTFGLVPAFLDKETAPRTHILIHTGNFTRDIRGCLLTGTRFADIDGDGTLAVAESRIAFNKLMAATSDEFILKITKA